jgi:hypothetical protein
VIDKGGQLTERLRQELQRAPRRQGVLGSDKIAAESRWSRVQRRKKRLTAVLGRDVLAEKDFAVGIEQLIEILGGSTGETGCSSVMGSCRGVQSSRISCRPIAATLERTKREHFDR